MTQIFVAWVAFQRRIESMESHFGYEAVSIPAILKPGWLRAIDYLLKAVQTIVLFLQKRPDVIWIQQPPSPLLYLTCFYQAVFDRQVKIIADCHNAALRKPWVASPFVISLLNRCDIVLVHNQQVQDQALAFGIDSDRLVVLRDRSAKFTCNLLPFDQFPHPWILTPCSFNADEPIEQILNTARQAPELTFVITGNSMRAKGKHDLSNIPPNVKLTGFLPKAEFDALLCQTDIVLGLTKLDGIQLSVAGEAVSVGKPIVLSNTATLQQLFHKGAMYVDPLCADSIAQGCRLALLHRDRLAQEVCELREESDRQWLEQANQVWNLLKEQAVCPT